MSEAMDRLAPLVLDPQKPIIDQLLTVEGMTADVRALLEEVYADGSLVSQRIGLNGWTQNHYRADDPRLQDDRLKAIKAVRQALFDCGFRSMNLSRSPDQGYLKDLVVSMGDGDLAAPTYRWRGTRIETEYFLGDSFVPLYLIQDMVFSPELQLEITSRESFGRDGLARELANNLHLTEEAQLAFIGRDLCIDANLAGNLAANSDKMLRRMLTEECFHNLVRWEVAFSDRDFSPEIQELIDADTLLSILNKAKKDEESELTMLRHLYSLNDLEYIGLKRLAMRSAKIFSRESALCAQSLDPDYVNCCPRIKNKLAE